MEASQLGPSYNACVVLDIGADVGALVLMTPLDLEGDELELWSVDRDFHVHTAVRKRVLELEAMCAAVYPHLLAGSYRIERTGQVVTVQGGLVTTEVLGAPAAGASPKHISG
jgi:hypothetical protein